MSSHQPPQDAEADFDFAPFGFMHGNATGPRASIDITKFLLSIWKPLILGGCLGGMAGIGVYLWMGPVYSAYTQVLVSKKASVPINDGEANRFGERGDHVELIKSDLVIEPAFKSHGLSEVPELVNAYDPYKNIREGLSVTRSSGQESSFDNIFDIEFMHPDKEIAKKVVQAIVDSYREYLHITRDENSKQVYQTLMNREKDLTQEITDKENQYRQFREQAPVFIKASPVISAGGAAMPPQSRYEVELSSIEETQNENRIKQTAIEAKLAELERRRKRGDSRESLEFWVTYSLSTGTGSGKNASGGGGAGALAGPPVKADLDQQFLTARLLEQRLLHVLGEEHTAVRNLRRQIDTILDSYRQQGLTAPAYRRSSTLPGEGEVNSGMDLVSVYEDTLKSQLEELKIVAQNLDLMQEDAQKKAKDAELYQVEDQRLKEEIAVLKTHLSQIFDQIATYDISKEQEGYRMKQIAQVRLDRSLKRVIKIVGMFGCLGIGLVFVLSYLREWLDTRVKTIEELKKLAGTKLVGTIPEFVSSADADRLAQQTGLSPALVYYHRPAAREAEAFRTIRTTLFHSVSEDDQVLLVSSAEPGDGKSTVVVNMALAMAQAGKKVLLIDADLRRPTMHQLLGLQQEVGLTDVLLNEITWQNALRATPIDALSVMTAGLCPENPAELLSQAKIEGILKEMRKDFDFIIFDSPPVLAVSDPTILAPYADGVLVVARLLKNKRASVTRMMETLNVHGAKLLGLVANSIQSSEENTAGYGGETYGHYFDEPKSTGRKATSERKPMLNV